MDSMVERVAKAICAAETGGPFEGGVWEEYSTGQHKEWREAARAAINAMMESTEAMVEAGLMAVSGAVNTGSIDHLWQAMLTAALTDDEGGS